MAKRSSRSAIKKATKRANTKNSLVNNINKRKQAHKSRSKSNSTVSADAYEQMQAGWPKKKKKRVKKTTKAASSKKKQTATKSSKPAGKLARTTKSRGSKKAKRSSNQLQDPQGGLTAAGRRAFRDKDGSHLRPGVKGPADTPEKMRRKGSFLRRHFATLRGPLVDEDGQPTRLALQAHAWGEPVPRTAKAAQKLADKGAKLLERYHRMKSSK